MDAGAWGFVDFTLIPTGEFVYPQPAGAMVEAGEARRHVAAARASVLAALLAAEAERAARAQAWKAVKEAARAEFERSLLELKKLQERSFSAILMAEL